MKNTAFGLCVVAGLGICCGMSPAVQAADTWQSSFEPVYASDGAGGHVVVVYKSSRDPNGIGESHIVVVAHGLLPNTDHLVRAAGIEVGTYDAIVSTNNAGVLTLQDTSRRRFSFADIYEPDGEGGWAIRLMTP